MYRNRTNVVLITTLLAFMAILIKLFYLQIIKGSEIKKRSIFQTYKLEKFIPKKGIILSSDNFPLAMNQYFYQMAVYKPNLKTGISETITQINQILPGLINPGDPILKQFSVNPNTKWLDLPINISPPDRKKINIQGIEFKKITARYYPEGELSKPLLLGIDQYYSKQLSGKTGYSLTAKDALNNSILTKKSWIKPPVDGQNLNTYINRGIQNLAETLLSEGLTKYSADSGSIIIIDPKTAGVMAMTSQESSASATASASKNPAISDLFEPGSIFKPLVIAMALDKKMIGPDFICTQCDRSINFGKYSISNWNNELHPDSTLKDIIKNSDNIGMSQIITKLKLENFLYYYSQLGLNQKTGIDLQGESKSTIKKYWSDIDLATASFGQGVAITRLQMIQAFNTIANSGLLTYPRIVKSITDNNKHTEPIQIPAKRIFSDSTTKDIKTILKYAVENGTVSKLKPQNMEVCAKSGTAQIAVKGIYSEDTSIASYIGFSPCQNPKFTMLVTIVNPKTSPWGSSTAAPIWFDLAQRIYNLL